MTGCDNGALSEHNVTTTVNPQANPGQTNPGHNNHGQGYGNSFIVFTDSNDNIWPPQPTDITEIETIAQIGGDTNDIAKKAKSRANIRQKILNHPQIKTLLGENIAWLGIHQLESKSGDDNLIEMEVFGYDTNTLVTVVIDTDTNEISDYRSNDANIYQPAESREEVSRAIALAYNALLEQGFTEHKNLTGTGLLAYPNAAEAAESGHTFYNDRKLYVTFGTGDGTLPQYRATVNLSSSVVEHSGAIE